MKEHKETTNKVEKKIWVKPTISQIDITKTEGGFLDVDWEGPTYFLFSS